jgi:hypothetical protein
MSTVGPVTWDFAGWARMLARPGTGTGCSGQVMKACGRLPAACSRRMRGSWQRSADFAS